MSHLFVDRITRKCVTLYFIYGLNVQREQDLDISDNINKILKIM